MSFRDSHNPHVREGGMGLEVTIKEGLGTPPRCEAGQWQ